LITAVAILGGDIVVMFILPLMKFLPPMVLPYIDGILLTVVATPFLYFLLYRPLVHTIEEQQRAEDALSTLNAQLEGRIAERTKELEDAVTVLQKEVAARREVEARLVKTNQFTQRLIECAPCLMAVIDVKDMRCSYVNGRISDLLGFEPEAATLAGSSFLSRRRPTTRSWSVSSRPLPTVDPTRRSRRRSTCGTATAVRAASVSHCRRCHEPSERLPTRSC